MKVLMFGWEFPPHISGGLGMACYGLTKSLAKQNVEILFVMPKSIGDEDLSIGKIINASEIEMPYNESFHSDFWNHVNFLSVNAGLVPYLGLEEYLIFKNKYIRQESNSFNHLGGKYSFSGKYGKNLMEEVLRYAWIAAKIAQDNDFDIIHAHDWLTYLAGIIAKKISGKPLIVHVHATEFDRSGENINRIVYDLEKQGMEQADAVIAVSNLTRNIIINRYGINANKVFTIYNAVNFSKTNYAQNLKEKHPRKKKIITFLGRITFQKGPEYFIEAARKVLKSNPEVHFVMAGNGDLMNQMIDRVAKLNMGTKFTFTGFLTGNDVNEMYSQSDIYVMPSVSEPFGISPLEAMSKGIPVIISEQSGVAEVLKNAIKVNFWDIDALADAIHALLTYSSLSEYLSKNGNEEANSMNWSSSAKQVKNLYKQIIQTII